MDRGFVDRESRIRGFVNSLNVDSWIVDSSVHDFMNACDRVIVDSWIRGCLIRGFVDSWIHSCIRWFVDS